MRHPKLPMEHLFRGRGLGLEELELVNKDDVVSGYELLLDRSPETEAAIERKCQLESLDAVILELVTSEEFMARNRAILTRLFS